MQNHLQDVLAAGKTAIGAQMRFSSPAIAEAFGHAGFDFIVIDGEHGPQTPVSMQAQFQGIGCTNATPIARLVKNDPDQIRMHLDLGAGAVTVPFIGTAEQATIGARACRYPPVGTRGVGASRGSRFGYDADYFQQANDKVLYLPIIETAEAVANIDEIVAVAGVDSFFVGPADLTVSMGIPFQFEDAAFLDALRVVVRAAEAAGIPAGIGVYGDVTKPETLKRCIDAGFRLLLAGGDEPTIKQGCDTVMSAFASAQG